MVIAFTKTRLEHGWMGNMSAFPIYCQNKNWPTTEHLFQALRFHENEEIQELIRCVKSPMAAKMQAKANAAKMTVEPASKKDIDHMEFVLRLKLEQYPQLKVKLLETGNELIIEDVSNRTSAGRHNFWGMSLKDGQWCGENMLGLIWMKIREELRNGESATSTSSPTTCSG